MKRAHDCDACSCDCSGCASSDPKRPRLDLGLEADPIGFDGMVNALLEIRQWQDRAKTWADLSTKDGPLLSEDEAKCFVADYFGTHWTGTKHHPDFVRMLPILAKSYTIEDMESSAGEVYLKHMSRRHVHDHFVAVSPMDLFLRANLFYTDEPQALEDMCTLGFDMGRHYELIGLVCWAICARQHPDRGHQRQMDLTRTAMVHLCHLLLRFYGPLVGVRVVEYESTLYSFTLKKNGSDGVIKVEMPRLVEFWFGGFRMPNFSFGEVAEPSDEVLRALFSA